MFKGFLMYLVIGGLYFGWRITTSNPTTYILHKSVKDKKAVFYIRYSMNETR